MTLVVVQARMGSSRLPGKVLLNAAGRPLLEHQLRRMLSARQVTELVVATTTSLHDEPIRALCRRLGVRCFSGHSTDLLDRHYRAARELGADAVVKIPSDCPLIDPDCIDRVLSTWSGAGDAYDYVSNLHPPSWPDGNDVEVFSMAALELAWREAVQAHEREHTTPFLWDRPGRFRVANVSWETGWDLSESHRFTLDYPEDYALIRAVIEELDDPVRAFRVGDVLELLRRRPELVEVNASRRGYSWMRQHLGHLNTIHDRAGKLCWS